MTRQRADVMPQSYEDRVREIIKEELLDFISQCGYFRGSTIAGIPTEPILVLDKSRIEEWFKSLDEQAKTS